MQLFKVFVLNWLLTLFSPVHGLWDTFGTRSKVKNTDKPRGKTSIKFWSGSYLVYYEEKYQVVDYLALMSDH